MKIQTVYQDQYLLVVDKPPGLVVAPAETTATETLADILQQEFGIELDRGGIVHRLDKDTSGLLLVAKTQPVLEQLQAQFKERSVKKEYLCLVHGWLDKPGVIEGAIGRNPGDREKFVVLEEGKAAVTSYQPIQKYQLGAELKAELFAEFNKIQQRKLERSNYGQFTYLRCFPQTGRTHQIRVHLKHIGHPLAGDQKYGGRKTSRLDHRLFPRQFLHAARLQFVHPITGDQLDLASPLPEDLAAPLQRLTAVN